MVRGGRYLWGLQAVALVALVCAQALDEEQVEAMIDIRGYLNVPSSLWNLEVDPCQWEGVTCTSRVTTAGGGVEGWGRDVVGITLQNQGLSGQISDELYHLTALSVLKLDRNQITGTLPASLSSCVRLEELYLHENQIESTIPEEWSALRALRDVVLKLNPLLGTLPAQWSALSEVRRIWAYNAGLTGSLPAEWSGMSKVREMHVQENKIEGPIPASFSAMGQLELFNASFCKIEGSLPEGWSRLGNLETLDLAYNSLTGIVPPSWFAPGAPLGSSLKELNLESNGLSGPFPDPDTPPEALFGREIDVDLSGTRLVGCGTPPALAARLTGLRLSCPAGVGWDTSGEGWAPPTPTPSPDDSGGGWEESPPPASPTPDDGGSGGGGESPPTTERMPGADAMIGILNLRDQIRESHKAVANGGLEDGSGTPGTPGAIEDPLSSWEGDNPCGGWDGVACGQGADGEVAIVQLNLAYFGLHGEAFEIPAAIASELKILDLSHNFIHGTIPSNWAPGPGSSSGPEYAMPEGSGVYEDDTGPTMLAGGRRRLRQATAVGGGAGDPDPVTGEVTPGWPGMNNLEVLSLSGNNLTGTLPPEFGAFKHLRELRLDLNLLTGTLPPEWGSLDLLQVLDLSYNDLSGSVPSEWNSMRNLLDLNLSYNAKVCGFFSGGIEADFSPSMAEGTAIDSACDDLLPSPPPDDAPSPPPPPPIGGSKGVSLVIIVAAVAGWALLAIAVACICVKKRQRARVLAEMTDAERAADAEMCYPHQAGGSGKGKMPPPMAKGKGGAAKASSSRGDAESPASPGPGPGPTAQAQAANAASPSSAHAAPAPVPAWAAGGSGAPSHGSSHPSDRDGASSSAYFRVGSNGSVPSSSQRSTEPPTITLPAFTREQVAKLQESAIQVHTWEDLMEATDGFSPANKIGDGGYGAVYRGHLRHTAVAIKVLDPSSMQGGEEFHRELHVLGRIRHPNILMLLGCCPERAALVYELMPGGSLEERLADGKAEALPWHMRVRAGAEVATALLFLHSSSPEPIIHRDIKPANVLLDRNLTSKVGDVGLARLCPELAPGGGPRGSKVPGGPGGRTYVRESEARGTLAYLDPEYVRTGAVGPKSDVYALGVTMLQLLTGRSPMGVVDTVEDALDKGDLGAAMDPRAADWPREGAERFARLALQCCQMRRKERPDLETAAVPELRALQAQAEEVIRHAAAARVQGGGGGAAGGGGGGGGGGEGGAPSIFLCPITQEPMRDPVVAADGYCYDREAIASWLKRSTMSPMTNLPLAHLELTPNHSLRSAIMEWLASVEGGGEAATAPPL